MARPSAKAQARKKDILENFYSVLVSEGLEGASIAKIAARMGIHPSLIIHYFSTKEEMIVALVDYMLDMYEEAFLPSLEGIEDPAQRLEAGLDVFFGAAWADLVDPGVFHACFSLSFRNRRVKESFQKVYRRLGGLLTGEIGVLMHEGILPEGDPLRLADFIISLMEGYCYYRSVLDDDKRSSDLGSYIKRSALAILGSNHAPGGK